MKRGKKWQSVVILAVVILAVVILAGFVAQPMPAAAEPYVSPLNVHANDRVNDRADDHALDELTLMRSNQDLRQDKLFAVRFEPIGFSVAPIPSIAIAPSYYLSATTQLELDYARGESESFDVEVKTETFGIGVKQFVGDSFYIKIGLGHRYVQGDNSLETNGNTSTFSSLSFQTITGDVVVGNEWQHDGFFISCDWIGQRRALKTYSRTGDISIDTDDHVAKEAEADLERIGSGHTWQMLRFGIGHAL